MQQQPNPIDGLVQQPYLQRYQRQEDEKKNGNSNGKGKNGKNGNGNGKNVKNLIPASKRLTVTYVVFSVWVGLAIFGILMGTDLISLSVYFASGLPLIIGYLWSETSRPSGSIKDVSKLVESMMGQNYWMYGQGGGFNQMPGTPYYGPNNYGPNYGPNQQQQQQQQQQNTTVIIVSDDNSDKIEINENELDTLLNSGYVTKTKGKYTFRREQKQQIVSLVDGGEMRDEGIYAEEEASI